MGLSQRESDEAGQEAQGERRQAGTVPQQRGMPTAIGCLFAGSLSYLLHVSAYRNAES